MANAVVPAQPLLLLLFFFFALSRSSFSAEVDDDDDDDDDDDFELGGRVRVATKSVETKFVMTTKMFCALLACVTRFSPKIRLFFSAFLVNELGLSRFTFFFPQKHHNARSLSLLLGAFRDARRTPPRSSSSCCCSRYSLLSARVALRSSARGAHRGGAAKIDANEL